MEKFNVQLQILLLDELTVPVLRSQISSRVRHTAHLHLNAIAPESQPLGTPGTQTIFIDHSTFAFLVSLKKQKATT